MTNPAIKNVLRFAPVAVLLISSCVLEVSNEEDEVAVVTEELFTGAVTMSLAASEAPVTHTSAAISLTPWSVVSIQTPGTIGLRRNRWKFDVMPVDGFHVGYVRLAPAIPGNPMDIELARLASINAQIVLKVAFNGVTKEDLVVNLRP